MSDTNLLLLWATAVPLAGALLGMIWSRHPGWDFVDLPYYFLGIVGVVLFFFASQRERQLLNAREEAIQMERVWAQYPNPKPAIRIDQSDIEALGLSHARILEEQRVGDSCRNLPSHACIAYADHADAISETMAAAGFDWESPDPEIRLRTEQGFCAGVLKLVERLQRDAFDADAYALLKQHLANRRAKNPFLPDRDDLARDIARRQSRWLEAISPTQRAWAKERMEIEGRFAFILFEPANRCALRQAADRQTIESLDAWVKEEGTRANAAKRQRVRIDSLSQGGDGQGLLAWMRLKLWPYVIIFALALKFGKATAGVTAACRRKREAAKDAKQSGCPAADFDAPAGTGQSPAQP